jgi:hypothetical protein
LTVLIVTSFGATKNYPDTGMMPDADGVPALDSPPGGSNAAVHFVP